VLNYYCLWKKTWEMSSPLKPKSKEKTKPMMHRGTFKRRKNAISLQNVSKAVIR